MTANGVPVMVGAGEALVTVGVNMGGPVGVAPLFRPANQDTGSGATLRAPLKIDKIVVI